jgi:transposase InsO family protein
MVLTDVDQLWRADITYIRLREEFVFLAVMLDAYSRRVIGWALDRTLEEELTLSLRATSAVRTCGFESACRATASCTPPRINW